MTTALLVLVSLALALWLRRPLLLAYALANVGAWLRLTAVTGAT